MPMPLHFQPRPDAVRAFLDAQSNLDFSYAAVGATATAPPAGYVVDHTRVRIGAGERAFDAARAALERWDQFRLGWVEAFPADDATIRPGGAVAVVARTFGAWWLNA